MIFYFGFQILILPADFEKAKSDFVPISLRDVKLQKSDVSWDDIGGTLSITTLEGIYFNDY